MAQENDNRTRREPGSYWMATNEIPTYPSLQSNESTDIAVIGGGIAGIITAYLLAKEGKEVTLLEAGRLVGGVTGNTTAKISAQHGTIYSTLMKTAGEKEARLYYEANLEGLQCIENLAQELGIDCMFSRRDAFIYANTEAGAKLLEKEADAYWKLGIDGELAVVDAQAELPFDIRQALVMRNQAQFNPVQFLGGLVKELEKMNVKIYENTRAVKVLSKHDPVIQTENLSRLMCNKVIVATHYPFNDSDGLYFARMAVNRSYAIAAKVSGKIPQGMYISVDQPKRSLRSIEQEDGESLLMIGGEGHGSGKQTKDTMEYYKNLEQTGREQFGLEETLYHWSAQDMSTLDKIPYIGTITAGYDHILVATGFDKWGMAHGAVAARLLTDQVMGRDNKYRGMYKPTRSKMKTVDAVSFLKDNASVAKELVKGKLKMPSKTIDSLSNGQGALVKHQNERAGAYRDKYGQLHLVDATCTHMGCETKWNEAERSWDCPCHGSRFSYTGEVLNGPAVKPLKKLEE